MSTVFRSPQAELDLIEIWLYIAADNPNAADELLDEVDRKCTMLADSPKIGRHRQELGSELRSFPVGNYLIVYRAVADGIEVARVLHGARDLEALF